MFVKITTGTCVGNRTPDSVSPNHLAPASGRQRPFNHDTGAEGAIPCRKPAWARLQGAV